LWYRVMRIDKLPFGLIKYLGYVAIIFWTYDEWKWRNSNPIFPIKETLKDFGKKKITL